LLEIGFIWVEGGSEAKVFARLMACIKLIPLGFFVAATVLTALLEGKSLISTSFNMVSFE
jgi:hypothetical protein